jgi:hypothetical protein
MESHSLVGRAQGVLMERFDIDADHAFAILRRYSQDHNVKLTEVAASLLSDRDLRSAMSTAGSTDDGSARGRCRAALADLAGVRHPPAVSDQAVCGEPGMAKRYECGAAVQPHPPAIAAGEPTPRTVQRQWHRCGSSRS